VLERRKEILGPDHPDTTVSAWNLFTTLIDIEEIKGAQQIISENLLWLLDEDATLYDSNQQQIRAMLKRFLKK